MRIKRRARNAVQGSRGMVQTFEDTTVGSDYQVLLSRSVQLTAEACAAWAAGDWSRGALLICQAADLERAAVRSAGGGIPPQGHAA
jgi:hypothetical protein